MYLWLHFLLILQFWTVLSRIVQHSAWSLDIHCVSVFWWSCSSCHMLECTLLNHQWFNNFFSFIACFWWSLYTFSFILLWSFHVILLRKWKSWWFSSMHSAVAYWCFILWFNNNFNICSFRILMNFSSFIVFQLQRDFRADFLQTLKSIIVCINRWSEKFFISSLISHCINQFIMSSVVKIRSIVI